MATSRRRHESSKGRVLESRDPLLTEISKWIFEEGVVDALATYLLENIPPYGPGFIARTRAEDPTARWTVIATKVLRCWCDSSETKPRGEELYSVLKKIDQPRLAERFRKELLDDGEKLVQEYTAFDHVNWTILLGLAMSGVCHYDDQVEAVTIPVSSPLNGLGQKDLLSQQHAQKQDCVCHLVLELILRFLQQSQRQSKEGFNGFLAPKDDGVAAASLPLRGAGEVGQHGLVRQRGDVIDLKGDTKAGQKAISAKKSDLLLQQESRQSSNAPLELNHLDRNRSHAQPPAIDIRATLTCAERDIDVAAAVQFCSGMHFYQSKWSTAISPLEKSTTKLRATSLEGNIYIMVRQEDNTDVLFCTSDLREWQQMEMQAPLKRVSVLSHYKNKLFCLASGESSNGYQRYVYWLSIESGKCSPTMAPNGKCPHDYYCESAINIEDSLLLFGGSKCAGSYCGVAEYNTATGNWVCDTKWPALPQPLTAAAPVLLPGGLHLFSLSVCTSGETAYRSEVMTLKLDKNFQPVSLWISDFIPPTPHAACGVVQLHGHFVVAGGCAEDQKERVYYNDCYTLDVASRTWVALPSMPTARCYPHLVVFQQSLVAIGGSSHRPYHTWHTEVETWKTGKRLR